MNNLLDTILNAGLGAYTTRTNAATAQQQAQAQAATAQAATAQASSKWVPFAIIGGVVTLVLVVIFAFRK
jgi:hypothetical protein